MLASNMRGGQVQLLTQHVGQKLARFGQNFVALAVDRQGDCGPGHGVLSRVRSKASASAWAVSTATNSRRNSAVACRSSPGSQAAAACSPIAAIAMSLS